MKIAVLGATGHIGREVLQALADTGVPLTAVTALATASSQGAVTSYGEEDEITVGDAARFDFSNVDLVISAIPADAAQQLLPNIAKQGVNVIDCSPAFRMDPDVPLCVAGVNDDAIKTARRNIVALPDALTCMLVQTLKPLDELAGLQRVVVSTYQSASGEGRAGMDELFSQTRAVFVNDPIVKEQFPKQIAFNAIPQVGDFREDGQTEAEFMLAVETKKVLQSKIKVSVSCVRIASFLGSGMSVAVECERDTDLTAVRAALRRQSGLSVVDHRVEEGYVTPAEAAGEDSVYVSRLRHDNTVDSGLQFWVVADSTRAGVALNAARLALAWLGEKAEIRRTGTIH
ncbi:MAG: aspartate-semialdehyde dehydrogenase [Bdellovibrionales bacterium]